MSRVPPRAIGLRARLAAALLATSAATLLAAALIILPPQTHRLVDDRLADLRGLARTARPALHAVPARALRPGSPALVRLAARLERRTGGRIVIYDDGHVALADTAHGAAGASVVDLAAARREAARHRDDVATGRRGDVIYAVTAVRSGRDRLTLVIVKRLADTRAAEAVVREAFPVALAAGFSVALALALVLSRSLLARLARLRRDARALGEEGLRHPVAISGRDEVAEVAWALEAMRARLAEEEASRQAFVATASHELRTPLASLQATLELLREEVLEGRGHPQDEAARLEAALRQTHRLVGLATELLDLSRVDGHVRLELEPVELGAAARLVAREFAERLSADGRSIGVEGAPSLALADGDAVVRVLRILVDNAMKYGAGAVTLRLATLAKHAVVCVSDEGPGLERGEEDAVFVRFARGHAAGGVPGAGLGLAIARGLTQAMGGDLVAQPAPRGARFALRLATWQGEAVLATPNENRTTS